MRFSALLAVSRVVVLAAAAAVCGLSSSGQVVSAPIPAMVPQDGLTTSGLPDAPGSLYRRPAPPPIDANRLLSPEVWSSSDDDDAVTSGSGTKFMVDDVNLFAVSNVIRKHNHKHESAEDFGNPVTLEGVAYPEHYHWGGLLAQSYFFNLTESAFRIASDDQIRYLVAKKPFWHDYVASMKQFNMRRWNDGDDFLVNYVGHPMQGAVSAYIEIQNSPRDRELEISATHDYWMSRFRGFLWAVAYSTHSEISPLGEAGIGNEGGWTYPIGCHKPCPNWHPKIHYTNNTGWVDFIITPTVGMLWVLAEDTLDRYVSNRVQGSHIHAVGPMILRGALNPSRTFANAMRLKAPWYRDWQHDTLEKRARPAIHMLRADESPAQQRLGRFSIAGHYRSMPLGTYLKSCTLCFSGHGGGMEVEYAITPWLNASFGLDKQQGLSEKNATVDGTATFTGFGIRLVHDRPHNTFSLVVRPGMVLDQAVLPAHLDVATGKYIPEKSSSMKHTAATLLAANDYKINRNFAVRSSLGVIVVRYKTNVVDPPGVGEPPYLSWLSHENYTNHTTWVWQGGPVMRF